MKIPVAPSGKFIACVYLIKNTTNGREYIGASTNIKQRIGVHRSLINTGKHYNKKIASDVAECGNNAFKFRILKIVTKDTRREIEMRGCEVWKLESWYIANRKPYYNSLFVNHYSDKLLVRITKKIKAALA